MKRNILITVLWFLASWGLYAESYTVSPGTTDCVNRVAYSVGGTDYYRGFSKLSATVSGSTATFTVSICDGTFPANTALYLKQSASNNLSTVLQSSTVKTASTGARASSYSFTHPLPFTSGSRHYSVVAVISGIETCTEVLTISAEDTSVPPVYSLSDATNITTTSATLNGTINPNGNNVGYLFEYGISPSNLNNITDASTVSGDGNISVSKDISAHAQKSVDEPAP
jgi:hypothetical protein